MARWSMPTGIAVFAACGGSGEPTITADAAPANACESGVSPPLDDCERGAFYADCNGTAAEPVLACRQNECLWFASGCVADGFTASTCAADEICCQADWPFATAGRRAERRRHGRSFASGERLGLHLRWA